jgi:hypothetical protein
VKVIVIFLSRAVGLAPEAIQSTVALLIGRVETRGRQVADRLE